MGDVPPIDVIAAALVVAVLMVKFAGSESESDRKTIGR